jgi:hypothetical protein
MKKAFLALFAGVALVLAFTLPVQAQSVGKYLGQADFNFRGQWWISGGYGNNIADYDDGVHDQKSMVFQRFRWFFDTSYEGKYGGTLGFEFNWEWGSDRGDIRRLVPGAVPNAIGGGPRGDDLPDVTRVKQATLWFMVPSTPIKVTAGLSVQGSIDPDNIMFGSDDYFGVRVDVPIIQGVWNLSAAWLKDSKGLDPGVAIGFGVPPGSNAPDSMSDDSDIYYIHMTAQLAKWLHVGQYNLWVHAQENGEYSADLNNAINFLGGRAYNGTVAGAFPVRNGDVIWNGLYFTANPGIFYFQGHVNYRWGSNDSPSTAAVPEITPAWAFLARAGIKSGPFSVLARGWWFDGDKTNGDTQYDKWFGINPFFATAELFYSGYNSWQNNYTGFELSPGGTAFLGIDASWQVTKQLTLELLAGHLWWTSTQSKPVLAAMYDDKEIGWEIDLGAKYKIYENLELRLGFNYLFAGAGLDHQRQLGTAFGAPVMDGIKHGADDSYEFFWRLWYSF